MNDDKEFVSKSVRFRNYLMCCLASLMESRQIEDKSSEELGEVVDMIKDLAEADLYISKKKYYETVTDAMDDYDDFSYRMGYIPDDRDHIPMDMYNLQEFPPRRGVEHRDHPYHKHYEDYKYYKKHYTETHSDSDRDAMKKSADETMHDVMCTLRDIWDSSDPDLKHKMREDIMRVINETT